MYYLQSCKGQVQLILLHPPPPPLPLRHHQTHPAEVERERRSSSALLELALNACEPAVWDREDSARVQPMPSRDTKRQKVATSERVDR